MIESLAFCLRSSFPPFLSACVHLSFRDWRGLMRIIYHSFISFIPFATDGVNNVSQWQRKPIIVKESFAQSEEIPALSGIFGIRYRPIEVNKT